MRTVVVVVAGLVLTMPARAHAESAETLRARGEQLAIDRHFVEAIDAFKAAEQLEPRALHACLIGLAYLRRELLPQAEIFLAQCETRASATDPLPTWVPEAKAQLAERLAALEVAPVEIVVEPAGAGARLAVSSFAPDEQFAPRTIHLPPGRHLITAVAPGYLDAQLTVDVRDRRLHQLVIRLQPRSPVRHVAEPAPQSKIPVVMIGVGGALAIAGGAIHGSLFRDARNDMLAASARSDRPSYDEAERRFDRYRALSIGFYAAGAATLGAGVVLALKGRRATEPVVSIAPLGGGGGMVSVGWSR